MQPITTSLSQASLKINCSMSTQPWRAAQSQTLFFSMAFVNFAVSFVYFLIVIQAKASDKCGPFMGEIPFDLITSVIILQPGVAGLILATSMYFYKHQRSNSSAKVPNFFFAALSCIMCVLNEWQEDRG